MDFSNLPAVGCVKSVIGVAQRGSKNHNRRAADSRSAVSGWWRRSTLWSRCTGKPATAPLLQSSGKRNKPLYCSEGQRGLNPMIHSVPRLIFLSILPAFQPSLWLVIISFPDVPLPLYSQYSPISPSTYYKKWVMRPNPVVSHPSLCSHSPPPLTVISHTFNPSTALSSCAVRCAISTCSLLLYNTGI